LTGSTAPSARPSRYTGSGLARLLAALDGDATPPPQDAFAERLSRWFDWTDAIALSAALNGPVETGAMPYGGLEAELREASRVRTALEKMIAKDPADARDGFAPWRLHCAAVQQAMEARVGPLRRRVRTALAGVSPEMARLAALDEAIEPAVAGKARALLATVVPRLERRFERLRDADPDAPVETWLEPFRRELRDVLLAELELRMQPVDGLLEACAKSTADPS